MKFTLLIAPLAALAIALLTWAFAAVFDQTPLEWQAGSCKSCDARHNDRIKKREQGRKGVSAPEVTVLFPIQIE